MLLVLESNITGHECDAEPIALPIQSGLHHAAAVKALAQLKSEQHGGRRSWSARIQPFTATCAQYFYTLRTRNATMLAKCHTIAVNYLLEISHYLAFA